MSKSIKTVQTVIMAVSVIFIAWIVASWLDVVLHNAAPLPHYQNWNAFVKLFDFMGWSA